MRFYYQNPDPGSGQKVTLDVLLLLQLNTKTDLFSRLPQNVFVFQALPMPIKLFKH